MGQMGLGRDKYVRKSAIGELNIAKGKPHDQEGILTGSTSHFVDDELRKIGWLFPFPPKHCCCF